MREIVKILPGEEYIYYSDNVWCPYGDKSAEQILSRGREITDYLLWSGADIIVIACNTATAAAIAALREEYSTPGERIRTITGGRRDHVLFVGMEPAVKPAALGTRSGVIGVLATAGTLAASKYLDTRHRFEDDVRIVEHVGEGFVELVESGGAGSPEAREVVERSLRPLLKEGADTIVLGCTHYPFLRDIIESIAGPDVRVIDPAPAVARQTFRVMQEEGLLTPASTQAGPLKAVFKTSGPPDAVNRLRAMIF